MLSRPIPKQFTLERMPTPSGVKARDGRMIVTPRVTHAFDSASSHDHYRDSILAKVAMMGRQERADLQQALNRRGIVGKVGEMTDASRRALAVALDEVQQRDDEMTVEDIIAALASLNYDQIAQVRQALDKVEEEARTAQDRDDNMGPRGARTNDKARTYANDYALAMDEAADADFARRYPHAAKIKICR